MVDRLICFILTVKHRHKFFLCWDFFSIGMGTQKKSKLDKENFHIRKINPNSELMGKFIFHMELDLSIIFLSEKYYFAGMLIFLLVCTHMAIYFDYYYRNI